jgi:hypothetical protein
VDNSDTLTVSSSITETNGVFVEIEGRTGIISTLLTRKDAKKLRRTLKKIINGVEV